MLKIETKSSIIIIATFVLGLGLGLISSQYLIGKRIDRLSKVRNRPGLENMIRNFINPTDDQRAVVDEILEKYSKQMMELRENQIAATKQHFQNMFDELRPYLTDEQIEMLKSFRDHRMKPGPRPEGRPPFEKPGRDRPHNGK